MDTVSATLTLEAWLIRLDARRAWCGLQRSERGEGVISAAIAVLVMAFLGAAMWVAFNGTMHTAQSKVDTNVNSIGSGAAIGGSGTGGTGGTGTGGSGLP